MTLWRSWSSAEKHYGECSQAMANIAGHPFMRLLLLQLKRHGFARVILSVGYQRHVIRDYLGEWALGMSGSSSVSNSGF